MRRPLCILCFGALGAQLTFAFLPQAVFLPFAAFFVLAMLLCAVWRKSVGMGCLALGVILGLVLAGGTALRIKRFNARYADREAVLVARVENVSDSYYTGMVSAELYVESVDGESAAFRCLSPCMPTCDAGDRITGRFLLSVPDESDRIENYADDLFFLAEYEDGFSSLGKVYTFRAVTHRIQQALSAALRKGLNEEEGGVLAAISVGDRTHLTTEIKTAYRAAGLSHVLVISGMHVTILCGGLFRSRQRERSRRSRVAQAWFSILMAILLAGITGFTPSVLRASGVVFVSACGTLLLAPADALTSLGVVGLCMTLGNSYAVCDVGFELSFAAVLGTLSGAALARYIQKSWCAWRNENVKIPKPAGRVSLRLRSLRANLCESFCVALCASLATFPVLLLRGMSASLYAVLSSIVMLWIVQPMMLLGLGAALTGLVSWMQPLYWVLAFCGKILAHWLTAWAKAVASLPYAQLAFETEYAVVACLLLVALGFVAVRNKVRIRLAVPVLLLVAGLSITLGNKLEQDVVSVTLLGSRTAPVVVVTENRQAMVLFRGGSSAQYQVEQYLEKRSIENNAVLWIDLRLDPTTDYTPNGANALSISEMESYTTEQCTVGDTQANILRTGTGVLVLLQVGNQRLAVLNGNVQATQTVEVNYLLASAASPTEAVEFDTVLTLSDNYSWLESNDAAQCIVGESGMKLRLRPSGGVQIRR
jgi:competence protein ComEC